jgi:hypothetical protein
MKNVVLKKMPVSTANKGANPAQSPIAEAVNGVGRRQKIKRDKKNKRSQGALIGVPEGQRHTILLDSGSPEKKVKATTVKKQMEAETNRLPVINLIK